MNNFFGKISVVLISIVLASLTFAQTPPACANGDYVINGKVLSYGSTSFNGYNAALTGDPQGGIAPIGVLGFANSTGAAGVAGIARGANVGVDATARELEGIGLTASNQEGGVALYIQSGSIVKNRTSVNLIRVFNKDTGVLVGEYEFEFVLQTP